jgi:hypothetical protein
MDLSPHSTRVISATQIPGPTLVVGHCGGWRCLTTFRPKLPMDQSTSSERPRKRRAINACVNCRTSKVRCDGKRPCQRCERNDAVCQYHEAVRDENVIRIEKLEAEVASLRNEMNNISSHEAVTSTSIFSCQISEGNKVSNAIEAGLITWEQAASWFQRYRALLGTGC